MVTYNFLYTSNQTLQEQLEEIKIPADASVLVRIHTAIHPEEQAVDLAKRIRRILPKACIFGTTTSSVIFHGRLMPDKCLISVTVLKEGTVHSVMLPMFQNYQLRDPAEVASVIRERIIQPDTRLMLTFFTSLYTDAFRFAQTCNEYLPGVRMIGGIANTAEVSLVDFARPSFVFNDEGALKDGGIFASLSGKELEADTGYATGAENIGDEVKITRAFGTCLMETDHGNAADYYKAGIGDFLTENPELTNIFPYVYSDNREIPFLVYYKQNTTLSELFPVRVPYNRMMYLDHLDVDPSRVGDFLVSNHRIVPGRKVERAFIYDRKIIADNQKLFSQISRFRKGETLFGYSCISRSMIYSNCVKWELSPYEDTDMAGCITAGEIACRNGQNTFANCSFVAAVMGEETSDLPLNEYAFSHTEGLAEDNHLLLDYLTNAEMYFEKKQDEETSSLLKAIRENYETRLLYTGSGQMGNLSRLLFDIRLARTDKVCFITMPSAGVMETFLSPDKISRIHQRYVDHCRQFVKRKGLEIYEGEGRWQLIIGAAADFSQMDFEILMRQLSSELVQNLEGEEPVAARFCLLTDFDAEDILKLYSTASLDMERKGLQFLVYKDEINDEKKFREQYEMARIIKDAITNDRVIPYYQGIRNNQTGKIDYYEALMRIAGSDGKIYQPDQFLPVAREYGILYDRLSYVMVQKVLREFDGRENVKCSINLSVQDIRNRDMVTLIFDFLSKTKYPGNFVFELLENEDIDNYEYVCQFTTRINMLGAKLALDDFGSGYANLMHIIRLEFNIIKIDGEIIRQCTTNKKCQDLIRMLSLWKKSNRNNIQIVAEYVENREIQHLIEISRIDYSQGYYFSRPEQNPAGLTLKEQSMES